MTTLTSSPNSTAARLSGLTYIVASVGFLAVFSWLAARFGYPDVLDHSAAEVLPQLLALGSTGRAVWMVYAVLPLLLIPAAVGAAAALRRADWSSDAVLHLAVLLQVVSAFAMTLGLARWSTAQWVLAEAWPLADAAQQASMGTLFDAFNVFLGNAIGEFVGELTLYGSFAGFAVALWKVGAKKMAIFGALTAVGGWLSMFRNVTDTVQLAADITNLTLPLFLIAFGVLLLRWGRRGVDNP